jgi:hypothetical protein
MRYYIIEHPTRGILMDWEWDWAKGAPVCKPRFSDIKLRSEAKKFYSREELMRKIKHVKLPRRCYILESPQFNRVTEL